jgi:fluoride exporter
MSYILVFLGGGVGSVVRYAISILINQHYSTQFPAATLVVNALSSFILGLLMSAMVVKPAITENYRLLLATGFCGGFSTFSAFAMDLSLLLKNGMYWFAIANMIISVIVCVFAFILGTWIRQ